MSNFPNKIDDDVTLPPINNNLTEIGGEAINALRDATFNIEEEIGIGASGSKGSIAARLGVSLAPDGYIRTDVLNLLGLVTLPITNSQVASDAQIAEHKLNLNYTTNYLFDLCKQLSIDINTALGWINTTGIKLDPHISGAAFNHELSHIVVSNNQNDYLTNRFNPAKPPLPVNFGSKFRDNTNAYSLLNDLNNDYVSHQKSDGYFSNGVYPIYTLGGESYPSNFAHTAGGIYLNTSNYTVIPTAADSLQKFADFIDQNSIFLLGSRIQNLFTSGISRVSRSSLLDQDGYGALIVPSTPVRAYLSFNNAASPDDPNTGDDIIRFFPTESVTNNFEFDSQFSLVKPGDVIRVRYRTLQTEFLVKEKKYLQSTNSAVPSTYAIRIDGKNLINPDGYFDGYDGYASINKPLFNPEKYGVLSVSAAQILDNFGNNLNPSSTPSLIVSHPRGAVALGNGFDPSLLNKNNYYLYLVLYPNGKPAEQQIKMAPIDITGNRGATPGAYTLDSIIKATNNAFRKIGYNYRFVSFSYQGQFGIMLAEPYGNASFSIIAGELSSDGSKYLNNSLVYPKNIISYDSNGLITSDPLGFGKGKANIASPEYTETYQTNQSAFNFPTKVFYPLRRNNYYVDGVGVESDKFALEPYQILDQYGDGYWISTISEVKFPSNPNRVETTYQVRHDLSSSGIAVGKTLVVQSSDNKNQINFGRFTISDISYNVCGNVSDGYTNITVYDSIQGNSNTNGSSPPQPIPVDLAAKNDGYQYLLYFNSDSVGFNSVNAFDSSVNINYKRHFEIYLNKEGKTFSLERGRMNISGAPIYVGEGNIPLYSDSNLAKINISRISPKLRGYPYGTVSKISLLIKNYNQQEGTFSGQLVNRNGSPAVDFNLGPLTIGRKGEVVRFYDDTGIDYIDFVFDIDSTVSDFSNVYISIQLFPTLALDDELLLLASAQLNSVTNIVDHIVDLRQFGNISEKDLSTSVLNYISAPERLIHANGVVRGFDASVSLSDGKINLLEGGNALVNGKFVQLNNAYVQVPSVKEIFGANYYDMLWALCVNDKNEYQFIALLDGVDSSSPKSARNLQVIDVSVSNGSLNPYSINAIFFKDLINNKKDLTPLYVLKVNCIYNGSNGVTYNSIILNDVRKFINNEPLNNTFTWADVSANNNIVSYFHTFEAVKNWINFYGKISNRIIIKGDIATTGTVDFSQINLPAIFEGDGSEAGFTMSSSPVLQIGSNIIFKDLKIKFLESGQILQPANNAGSIFENVEFKFEVGDAASALILDIKNNNNFNNCIFPKIRKLTAVDNNVFNNCIFELFNLNEESPGPSAIYLNSKNNFNKCSFAQISSLSYAIYGFNYNSFNECIFGIISCPSSGTVYLLDYNKFIDCKFSSTIDGYNTIFELRDYNEIANTSFEVVNQKCIEANENYYNYFLDMRNNNLINRVNIKNINCSTSVGAGIRAYGANNSIDRLNIGALYCNPCGIVLGYDNGGPMMSSYAPPSYNNSITNSIFNSLQSKKGIYLKSKLADKNGSLGSNILIDNNYINYVPPLFPVGYFPKDDKIKFIGGGGIFIDDNISNVKITNCTLTQNDANDVVVQDPPPECNCYPGDINEFYQIPPLVCCPIYPSDNKVIDSIVIDKCRFAGVDAASNAFYSAIAFIVKDNTSDSATPVTFSNILVTNNISYNYNGFIMAGASDQSLLQVNNVVISENKFSYISAYSSPSTDNGNILIEGNTCEAILTLNFYAEKQITTPRETGSMIIDNNSAQYINVYINDGSS